MSESPPAAATGVSLRNLLTLTFASFVAYTSFALVMPFLPLYFRELGVSGTGPVALWTGVSLGVTPAMTAFFAPLWGRLADRFGRKMMVQRSLVSFVVTMTLTGFATEPWHVVALRVLQGFFSGYGALTLTMAADSAAPGRMASALGWIHTSQRLGPAFGPVIGGVLAEWLGIRRTFFVAAGVFGLVFVLLLLFYEEPTRATHTEDGADEARPTLREIVRLPNFVLLMAAVFAIRYVERSFGPILPLYVGESGVPADRVALISGVLFSVSAVAGAVGHRAGAELYSGARIRVMLVGGSLVAAAATLMFVPVPPVWLLIVAMAVLGTASGVAVTAAYTASSGMVSSRAHGASFGLFASAGLSAIALSPVASGLLAALSLRAVFLVDGGLLVLLAVFVWATMSADRGEDAGEASDA